VIAMAAATHAAAVALTILINRLPRCAPLVAARDIVVHGFTTVLGSSSCLNSPKPPDAPCETCALRKACRELMAVSPE